jgi:hypothetical protein
VVVCSGVWWPVSDREWWLAVVERVVEIPGEVGRVW